MDMSNGFERTFFLLENIRAMRVLQLTYLELGAMSKNNLQEITLEI